MDKVKEKYLRSRLRRFADMRNWEDAVQEAMIQYWRDSEITDENHRISRAVIRGRQIVLNSNGAHPFTGHIRTAAVGYTRPNGDVKREKISQCIVDYRELHGTDPTNRHIAQVVGIDDSTVSQYRKSMRQGGMSVAPSEVTTESLGHDVAESQAIVRSAVEFEDDLVDALMVRELLTVLNEKERAAVHGRYWLGLSNRVLGTHMGVTQASVNRYLKSAHTKLRGELTA